MKNKINLINNSAARECLFWSIYFPLGQTAKSKTSITLTPLQPHVWPKELKPLINPNKSSNLYIQNIAFSCGCSRGWRRAKFVFRVCGHAATLWPKTAAAVKKILQNSHPELTIGKKIKRLLNINHCVLFQHIFCSFF